MNGPRGDGQRQGESGLGRDRSTTRHASAAPLRLGSIRRARSVAARRERVSSTPPEATLPLPLSDPRVWPFMNSPGSLSQRKNTNVTTANSGSRIPPL